MSVSKVELANGEVLIDITEDTVTPETLVEGNTAHGKDGSIITGTNPYAKAQTDATVDEQASLIKQIKTALQGKVSGGGSTPTQEKTVEIKENGTVEITPDEGYALSKVTANVDVPSSGGSEELDALVGLMNDTIVDFTSDKITKVSDYAITYRETLKTLSLPNLKSSNTRAFAHNVSLTSLSIPNMTGYTYQYMCAYDSALKTVDVKQASYVSSYSFYGCTSLTKIEFDRVGTIATNSFNGCSKLEALILRTNSVVTLGGTNAFTSTKISGSGGYIYVPSALVDSYKTATNWSTYSSKFRAIEDYPDICG